MCELHHELASNIKSQDDNYNQTLGEKKWSKNLLMFLESYGKFLTTRINFSNSLDFPKHNKYEGAIYKEYPNI